MSNPIPSIDVVDVHFGGDLHRVVIRGVKDLPGSSVLEQMEYLRSHSDGLRRFLLEEPRGGHPSIFADLIVRSEHADVDAGFIIFELMGYPKISGTNTMSTALALLETGTVPMTGPITHLRLEAPGGMLDVEAISDGAKVTSVSYEAATPSFVAMSSQRVDVPGYGDVEYDLTWTGAFYPVVDPAHIGLELTPENEPAIVEFAKAFVEAARKEAPPVHPDFGDEGPLTFLILAGEATPQTDGALQAPVACYEYPKPNVCRASAGTGTTAALIRLLTKGRAVVGQQLTAVSPFRTKLWAVATGTTSVHEYDAFTVRVHGEGWITARSKLPVDFSDPMTPQEGLEEVLARPAMAR